MKILNPGFTQLIAIVLAALSLSHGAMAGTSVKVSLWDKGGGSMDMMDSMKPMGMAMMSSCTAASAAQCMMCS